MLATTTPSDLPLALTAGGVLRDTLDGVCTAWEQILAILEEHDKRTKPFKGVTMSEQEATKEILTVLPPEKASALIAAFTDTSELAQNVPPEEAVKQLDTIKTNMANLQKIRDNLHKALDGVVP